jgi:hypothetical protein
MKKTALLICILCLCYSYSFAQTEDVRQSMIVFDSSGSMWGQVEGKAKISIAKEVLKNIISEWDTSIHVGLIAYGHRRKGDCNDIETLVPISKVDKKRFISEIEKINPKGKTPISRSLLMAAKELRHTEEKATVILISDGKENCDANPCETAEELEKLGVDFIIHVVGFDVDKETEAQLKCIAKVTGGKYFTAQNAEDLNKAMSSIVEEVNVIPIDNLEVKSSEIEEGEVSISASETAEGNFVKARHTLFNMKNGKKDKRRGARLSTTDGPTTFEKLPVGEYLIVSTYSDFEQETLFEIKPGETTKINVNF